MEHRRKPGKEKHITAVKRSGTSRGGVLTKAATSTAALRGRPALRSRAELDAIDLALIEELQENARTSFAELARRVHLSTPAVIDRVHRLEETGVILRYRAEIDPAALGLAVRAFVKVTVAGDRLGSFGRIVQEVPEVLECHRVTGNESYIVQVAVRDMNHLEAVIDSMMPYVATNTSMVLNSPVQSGRIAPHTGVPPTAAAKAKR